METQMPGGYTGRILRIDLTTERIWTETLTPEECRYYLGAVGIGYKILWEEVPPETAWDDPENRLFLGSGPLAGTPVWGTGSLTVVTRGAMTGGAVVTNARASSEPTSSTVATTESFCRDRPAGGSTST